MNAFYGHSGRPTEIEIVNYYNELVEYLVHGYLDAVEYGFKRGDDRVVSLKYSVQTSGGLSDSHAGGVYARADITGAEWFSFLWHNSKFPSNDSGLLNAFNGRLPFVRGSGTPPKDSLGYWTIDRSYSAGGVGTQRQIFRPY
jgi:hypothetical protein